LPRLSSTDRPALQRLPGMDGLSRRRSTPEHAACLPLRVPPLHQAWAHGLWSERAGVFLDAHVDRFPDSCGLLAAASVFSFVQLHSGQHHILLRPPIVRGLQPFLCCRPLGMKRHRLLTHRTSSWHVFPLRSVCLRTSAPCEEASNAPRRAVDRRTTHHEASVERTPASCTVVFHRVGDDGHYCPQPCVTSLTPSLTSKTLSVDRQAWSRPDQGGTRAEWCPNAA